MSEVRRKYSASGAGGIGPKEVVHDRSKNRKIERPKRPNFPECTSRREAGLKTSSHTRACHMSMDRPDFVQIEDPDMKWIATWLAEGEKFHGLWKCRCGRQWLRYTRLGTWGKREHRWTHIYKAEGEENGTE